MDRASRSNSPSSESDRKRQSWTQVGLNVRLFDRSRLRALAGSNARHDSARCPVGVTVTRSCTTWSPVCCAAVPTTTTTTQKEDSDPAVRVQKTEFKVRVWRPTTRLAMCDSIRSGFDT